MPNIKSAIKRVKVSRTKRAHNRYIKAGVKSQMKKLDAAVASGDQKAIDAQAIATVSTIDKAAQKGVFHKNKANRAKAQIAKRAAKA
nr:30S ribosomal protein S20 [bacterium]